MNKRRKRKLVAVVLLLLLLAMLSVAYVNYRAAKTVGLTFAALDGDTLIPPEYLYSFSGSEESKVSRPLGVLVDGEDVYVTDAIKAEIFHFDRDGNLLGTFGRGDMVVPLYIVKHPIEEHLYVSDRRLRTIHIFHTDGEYLGEFDPDLPEDELPSFDTGGIQWAPVALDFAEDGTLYVTELLNGHRLLIFGPDGEFRRSVGTAGMVEDSETGPGLFQFPNNIKVLGDEVWVVDSNNRRIQVFDREGEFIRFIETGGLPRGLDFLNRQSEDTTQTMWLAVVDTLGHDGTIWNISGDKVLNFGTRGVLAGQFSYPNDVSVDDEDRMFITDTANSRVQVWGWPRDILPVPLPFIPQKWGYCLAPLLLLPLLLLRRKRKFVATADFIHRMFETETAHTMPGGRREWLVTPADYESLSDMEQGDVRMSELLHAHEHSESDARSLMDRLELTYETAIILVLAQRARVFCTEDLELRRLGRTLEMDVVDQTEYIERFAGKHRAEPEPQED